MFNDLSRLGKYLGQAARLMVGMPDYDNYVEHMQTKHPDKPVMTYEAFFRERQEARYGGKGGPKCCLSAKGGLYLTVGAGLSAMASTVDTFAGKPAPTKSHGA